MAFTAGQIKTYIGPYVKNILKFFLTEITEQTWVKFP